MIKKLVAIMLAIMLLGNVGWVTPAPNIASAALPPLSLNAKSAVLMEAKTGQILFEMDADTPYPPASMSKMMTEYLVLQAVKSGKIKWDDIVTVSKQASDVDLDSSRIFLAEGDKHTVRELFIAMAVGSANDASIALAEFVASSEENFAKLMNQRAKEIGLSQHAHFINATGLSRVDMGAYQPKDIQGETMMTARDVAILAQRLLNEHPELLEFSSIPSYRFRERDEAPMLNNNWMLENSKDNFPRSTYEGLDGLKTGYTDEAQYCFTGTAKRGDTRYITVVMNTASIDQRFIETGKLLDYGFNNFEFRTVLPAKSEVESMKTVPIKKGIGSEVEVVTEQGIEFIVQKGEALDLSIETETVAEDKLIAPIAQGDILGYAKVSYQLGEQTVTKQVNLIATEGLEKAGWAKLLFRAIGNFFGDIFSGIANGLKSIF